MYKVFLADDNELSRRAIRGSVSWKNNFCKVVGEAENGMDACRQIRELGADIALLDIKMPGMTGLQVAKTLREEGIDCLCILVTAYDDFSFAREGLKLGVFDYLLKPVAEEELCEVIKKAVEKLQKEKRQSDREVMRRLLTECIRGQRNSGEKLRHLYQERARFREYCMLLVSLEEEFPEYELEKVLKECETCLDVVLLSVWSREGYIVLCVFQEILMSRDYNLVALKIGRMIVEQLKEQGSQAVVSISETSQRPEDMKELFEHTVFGRNSRFFLENQEVIHYDSLKSRSIRSEFRIMEYMEKFYSACRRQPENIEESLNRFLELLEKDGSYDVEYIRNIMVQTGIMMTCLMREKGIGQQFQKNVNEIMKELSDCITVQEAFEWLRSYAGELSGTYTTNQKYSFQTKRILDYLNQNYSRHISLQDVSEAMKLSGSHICRLLKNDTGETFVTMLNKIRIQNAIRLLREGELKVYEVAEQVGFSNYAYFYQLFKKETGLSPTNFK